MTTQVSIFDGNEDFVIDKPIRLIECFAGYGSQHLALKYLGVDVESYRICEWAVKSIQAYKDLHFPNDNTDYSVDLTTDEVIDYLANKGISANYNNPMTRDQVKRMGEAKCRQVYNNIKATHNLVNIMQAKASDLNIVERDKYCYIMTYSFPCQDLSKAGKGQGMAKDSGTRSGLLWEVERLLDECNGNLPQVLLMENVPDVIGTKNIKHFAKWLEKLESIGYKCYWKVLNGKDYGIPQNRERCFMVSILGDYFYGFPQGIKLEKRLKHLLEAQVDEKFYLSDVALKGLQNTTYNCSTLEARTEKDGVMPTICARDYKDPKLVVEPIAIEIRSDEGIRTFDGNVKGVIEPIIYDDYNSRIRADQSCIGTLTTNCGNDAPRNGVKIIEPLNLKQQLCNELVASGLLKEYDVVNHSYTNGLCGKNPSSRQSLEDYIESTNGIMPTITTRPDVMGTMINYRIRKLTPKECWRLMGVKDEDFERVAANQSNSSLYHLAGDSIITTVLMAIFSSMVDVDWRKRL